MDSAEQAKVRLGNSIRRIAPVRLGAGSPALGLLVGLAPGATTVEAELAKTAMAEEAGVATVTDLTMSTDDRLLRELLERDFAVGTVPTYAFMPGGGRNGSKNLPGILLSTIERHVSRGVDFLSVHASLTPALVNRMLSGHDRVIPVTSRGGALIFEMMADQGLDNPYAVIFDEILDLCAEHNVTLSFVGSFRPGSVADSFERVHLGELDEIAALVRRCDEAGVQTIVELINHVPLSDIAKYVDLGRSLFPGSAMGALGPSPTDIAVGLDDVAGAIGAANAAVAGVDWINLVTAGEHSHLPTPEDTEKALRYYRLALHIAEVAHGARERDRALSFARAKNDWAAMAALALDPRHAECLYSDHRNRQHAACSMCRAGCPLVRYQRMVTDRDAESAEHPIHRIEGH